ARYQDVATMREDLTFVRRRIESGSGDRPPLIARSESASPFSTARPRTPRDAHREAIAQRRATEIRDKLTAAREAFSARDFERAIAACTDVLVLDPDEPRALELADRSRAARDEQRTRELVTAAREHVDRGELT